jgi:hypothetical protein
MAAVFRFEQVSQPVGADNEAILTGVTIEAGGGLAPLVTLKALSIPLGATVRFDLLDAQTEPSSGGTVFTPDVTVDTATLQFSTGTWGTWRFQMKQTLGNGTVELSKLVFSVPSPAPNSGLNIPAYGERADQEASLINAGAAVIAANERRRGSFWDGYIEFFRRMAALISISLNRTVAKLHLYVKDTGGSDANSGLSAGAALKTLAAAIDKVPDSVKHDVVIHMGDGSYTLPSFTRSLEAPLAFYGDGAGVGDGFTVTQAAELADTGTSATQVVKAGGGLTPNAFKGHTLQITAGPGAGQRAMVKKNTATAFTFSKGALTVAPTDASTYRLVRPTVTLNVGAAIEIAATSAEGGGFAPTGTAPALVFAQLKLATTGFVDQMTLAAAATWYGVEIDNTNSLLVAASRTQFFGAETSYGTGGYPVALFGASSNDDWLGWGVSTFGGAVFGMYADYSQMGGYLVSTVPLTVNTGALFTLSGGRIAPSSSNPAVTASFTGTFQSNAGEIENEGTGAAVEARDNGFVFLANASTALTAPTGPLMKTRRGGVLTAGAVTGTAGGLVASAEGGQIYFSTNPSIDGGTPGSDYSAGIASPALAGKAAFASDGGGISNADGSLIVRNN